MRSLAVDGMSQLLVSGSADSKLVIWHIKKKKALKTINMGSSVARIRLHEESAMVAVALDDFSLAVVDLETKRIVRKFPGLHQLLLSEYFSRANLCLAHMYV